MKKAKKKKLECQKCGREIKIDYGDNLCSRCRAVQMKKAVKEWGRCRLCGRKFRVELYQDPRWTWWCPRCRARVNEMGGGYEWAQKWTTKKGVPDEETTL